MLSELVKETNLEEMSEEEALKMYREMLEIREFEHRVYEFYSRNEIRGSVHLYAGEEAVAVGACSALEEEDMITSTHRGHGHCLAKGGNLKKMMAELFGKQDGYCKGKGGSMHIADLDSGILGANGIVGGGIPLAVGSAWASDYKEKDEVTLCFFGDGAINQGAFHEAANVASLWDLPVVFVCENNKYGMTVPLEKASAVPDLAKRAEAYGIEGVEIEGNEVLTVHGTVKEAVKKAREERRPTLVVANTYRYYGHSGSDPCAYRSDEEEEKWDNKDPLDLYREKLIEKGIVTEEEADEIEEKTEERLQEAVEFAKNSPNPDPQELYEDIFVD